MKTVAIVGAGVIGAGWAARFCLGGWQVRVFDPDPRTEETVLKTLAQARIALTELYQRSPAEGQLLFGDSLEATVHNCDWVQESLPEDVDLKRDVLGKIDLHLAPEKPLCSSTSGFRPSVLSAALAHPERFFVCHPFNPVYLLPLVEVVAASEHNVALFNEVLGVLRDLSMRPLHVRKEIDGHVADRLLEALWREALWLVHDDVATTDEIDDAIKYGFGLRWAQMGLFETYRLAGGEAGMRHFLAQFGPALKWPWSKLTNVPDLDESLIDKIADQVEAQSGDRSITEMIEARDRNLVAILRALATAQSDED